MPRVSVIIPTHNRAHWVTQAIDSVLAQTYGEVEIIVVDDGSTDNTREVLARYAESISYVRQENAGPSRARNVGIRASQGEFLAFLDDDDLFLPEKLARQVAYLDAHPEFGVVYTGWQTLREDGAMVEGEFRPTRQGELLRDLLLEGYLFPPVAALTRRHCLDEVGLFDETLLCYEDPDLWIRLAKAGCAFGCIQEPLCQHRLTSSSLGQDVSRLACAVPAVLHKIFSDGRLPASAAMLEDEVYARRYLELAVDRYYALHGSVHVAKDTILRSYVSVVRERKPSVLTARRGPLDRIVYEAIKLDPADRVAHIQSVVCRLSGGARECARVQRRLLAKLHVVLAFQAHQAGLHRQVIWHILRGVRYDGWWLRDRGLYSLLLKGAFGLRKPSTVR